MSIAIVYSRAQIGVKAPLISVEVHLSNGLPRLSIVGLPDTEVKESKDRVRSAIINSHFEFPARRITINLAPADLPKEGARFELAIALGILAASRQIPADQLDGYEFIGELALTGELRPARGVLPAALQAASDHRALVLPLDNVDEAALVSDVNIYGARHLLDVSAHLNGSQRLSPCCQVSTPTDMDDTALDLADVHGQHQAKRALTVTAAGGHSLLMIGPPGTGKSMLAHRLPGILPPLAESEALETAAVGSISARGFISESWRQRPFRTPHHTASAVAMVGGGSKPQPGEISLAHNGILFLDELPEFERRVLEVLREPMESGKVTISRAAHQEVFPSNFQLIAAMNPCPCGHLGNSNGYCHCTTEQIQRYRARISGPLLDRIDMHIEVPWLPHRYLRTDASSESGPTSVQVRKHVCLARTTQARRQGKLNAELDGQLIRSHCRLDDAGHALLEQAADKLGLSARAYHRILKVARTIADLEDASQIKPEHLGEAINYRRLDRKTTTAIS